MSSPSSVPFVTNGDYYTTLSQKSKMVTRSPGTRSAQGIRLQFRLVEILGEWANCCVFYHNFTHQANPTASLIKSTYTCQVLPLTSTLTHFAQIMCKILYISYDKSPLHF
jgi:hypothetical protein